MPTELGAVSFGGAAAQAVATVTRRKLAKRKVFNIERENMRSPFGSRHLARRSRMVWLLARIVAIHHRCLSKKSQIFTVASHSGKCEYLLGTNATSQMEDTQTHDPVWNALNYLTQLLLLKKQRLVHGPVVQCCGFPTNKLKEGRACPFLPE